MISFLRMYFCSIFGCRKKMGRKFELMARKVSKPRIIVMTAYETEEDIRQALKAGVKAFLVKAAHPQQIREAVRKVAKGESFLPPEIGFKLAEAMSHPELSNRRRVESSRKSDEEIYDRTAFVTLAETICSAPVNASNE